MSRKNKKDSHLKDLISKDILSFFFNPFFHYRLAHLVITITLLTTIGQNLLQRHILGQLLGRLIQGLGNLVVAVLLGPLVLLLAAHLTIAAAAAISAAA